MGATLEQLEQRLNALEIEITDMRLCLQVQPGDKHAVNRGAAQLQQQVPESQARFRAEWATAYKKLGIIGQRVPAAQLRAMMIADGVQPEENLLSRGIREMREE